MNYRIRKHVLVKEFKSNSSIFFFYENNKQFETIEDKITKEWESIIVCYLSIKDDELQEWKI